MEKDDYKEEFLRIYNQNLSGRPGASDFLAWLSTTDFLTAPASSKYHLARPGGLVEHSVNVYLWLMRLMKNTEPVWNIESVTICGLLHDICKADLYQQGTKSQQIYYYEKGGFVQKTVHAYTVNDKFPYGHGEKSVYLIQKYMTLTDEEAQAIRFHMGPWQESDKQNASTVYKTNPLAFWLHVADEAATFRTEANQE